ncbi:MAG: helix-turn-helix domain-containing protein, partial [Acidimicrobiia bacterium]
RGEHTDQGIVLDLHLTQSDLARMVGGSRQSVNQILGTLSNRGYLTLYGRKILIKRLDLLRRRAGLEPFT